jgi:peptidoglycan DL-endopeptidase CwlO
VKRMPLGRRVPRPSSFARASAGKRARRAATLAATVAVCAAVLPAAEAGASPASPATHPGLNAILAKASALSQQIDKLSEQYDGLKIQLAQARSEAAIAKQNAKRDEQILGQDQSSIGAIAVENYMTGGMNPALELLQTSSPQSLLDRASMMTQIEHENGAKVSIVAAAETAAQRAVAAAAQQQRRAKLLEAAMAAKVAVIQKKENFFNSQAYQQAEAIFQRTGKYPISASQIPGDSVGVQALKAALTRIGYPYIWGAAGPHAFDCSGLVVWAYAQVGISLMHFTGDLWNEGEHVSRSELEPGDLVFFFADISHVGIYIGNGLMVDAPSFGQNVQVQQVFWNAYVGAVRILA